MNKNWRRIQSFKISKTFNKIVLKQSKIFKMPIKGKAKNTVNKAKHTKLIKQKVSKITKQKKQNKLRLKEIIKKMNS